MAQQGIDLTQITQFLLERGRERRAGRRRDERAGDISTAISQLNAPDPDIQGPGQSGLTLSEEIGIEQRQEAFSILGSLGVSVSADLIRRPNLDAMFEFFGAPKEIVEGFNNGSLKAPAALGYAERFGTRLKSGEKEPFGIKHAQNLRDNDLLGPSLEGLSNEAIVNLHKVFEDVVKLEVKGAVEALGVDPDLVSFGRRRASGIRGINNFTTDQITAKTKEVGATMTTRLMESEHSDNDIQKAGNTFIDAELDRLYTFGASEYTPRMIRHFQGDDEGLSQAEINLFDKFFDPKTGQLLQSKVVENGLDVLENIAKVRKQSDLPPRVFKLYEKGVSLGQSVDELLAEYDQLIKSGVKLRIEREEIESLRGIL